MRSIWLVLALALSLASAGAFADFDDAPAAKRGRSRNDPGARFKRALLKALDTASSIEVREHSDRGDVEQGEPYVEAEYRRVTLDAKARAAFRAAVARMDARTDGTISACMPEFHHTIRFVGAKGAGEHLLICFECGIVSWGRFGNGDEPQALWRVLSGVVQRAGMKTSRDWTAMARAAAAARPARSEE